MPAVEHAAAHAAGRRGRLFLHVPPGAGQTAPLKLVVAVFAFIGMECLVWGLGLWTVTYIYIWPILVITIMLVGKNRSAMTYSFISGLYGLFFGALCSIPFLFMGGLRTALGMWVSGIPFDIIHGAGNFIICLILFKPLNTLLTRIKYRLDEMSV